MSDFSGSYAKTYRDDWHLEERHRSVHKVTNAPEFSKIMDTENIHYVPEGTEAAAAEKNSGKETYWQRAHKPQHQRLWVWVEGEEEEAWGRRRAGGHALMEPNSMPVTTPSSTKVAPYGGTVRHRGSGAGRAVGRGSGAGRAARRGSGAGAAARRGSGAGTAARRGHLHSETGHQHGDAHAQHPEVQDQHHAPARLRVQNAALRVGTHTEDPRREDRRSGHISV